MPEQPIPDEDQLDRQLAELEENPNAPVDSSVRELHAKLETLAENLKESVPLDPYEAESSCARAVAAAKALARETTPASFPKTAAPAQPLPEFLEHFRIIRLLGQGGMGAVYLVQDTRLGREVALKTMRPELTANPEAKERFLREARLAATLEHDHIVPIYHVGEANGIPYLAMPFLKGQSLEDFLKRKSKLAMSQVIRLGIQIAEGLAAAHEHDLIHRDIKPANVWIEPTGGGRAKILDFGLARSSETDTGLTQSGAVLGTPSHMAPEQAKGEKVDGRADLYSLGVVLYRLATGQLPLRGTDAMSMLMALATETPRPAHEVNPEVPPALSDLITRLLAKDRNQRPASARAVVQELQALRQTLAQPGATEVLRSPAVAAPNEETIAFEPSTAPETKFDPRLQGSGRKRRRWPLVAAGLLFAFLGSGLLLQQIILRITDKDGKTREIELKPGDRIEIVEKPAPADAPPKKPPEVKIIAGDPDRKAAEYVLSIGGVVRVNGEGRDIQAAADLPKEPFRLTGVNPGGKQEVTDAVLAHFKDCKNLTSLHLGYFRGVTDAGLAHFKDCKNLTYLHLGGTQVTDAGLAHFKDCKNLTVLDLAFTRVTDAGLAHFKDCKNLTTLYLGYTRGVTDAGLAHFKDCKNLTSLNLSGTRVTDAGLAHFKDCKNLTVLHLAGTRVTDAGLAHFKDCKGLTALQLSGTRVTDESLAWIGSQFSLGELDLRDTRVSLVGYERLKAALPRCRIEWSEANRVAAEHVLALGGTVEIGMPGQAETRPVKAAADLPRELFQVRRLSLAGVAKPLSDLPEKLARLHLAKFDRLQALDLSGQKGLQYGFLASIAGLEELTLANAGLDDALLKQLPKLPALKKLVLDGNEIRGTGLAHLSGLPALEELSLGCPTLTDLFAKNLAELKQVKRLSLAGSGLSDEGLRHLEGLTQLEVLDLHKTRVTAAGIERLQKALPRCKIVWDVGKK